MIYGKVEINGEPAPDGTEVSAFFSGNVGGAREVRVGRRTKTSGGGYAFPDLELMCDRAHDIADPMTNLATKLKMPMSIVLTCCGERFDVKRKSNDITKFDISLNAELPANPIAEAIRELAEAGVVVNVDVNTESFAEAIAEATANVTVTITDLVEISNAITNMATGIENLDITNTINIGETAKKLQVTAKELERTAKKLEVVERGR